MQTIALMRPRSLADQAADRIRFRIVNGEFQLGEALSETTLAAELGVSKTPIREAFLRLASEGLVDIQPQRGTFVFQISVEEVNVLSDYRNVLEVAALRLAMRRDRGALALALKAMVADMKATLARGDATRYRELDDLFHRCIIAHCGNAYLAEGYAAIAFRVQSLRNRLSRDPRLNVESLEEHRTLARLIEQGLTVKVEALLRKHIAKTTTDYEKALGAD